MVAEVKVIAQAQDGTSKTYNYKPGDKHPAQSKTIYKLVVDGNEKLPPGTKITRSENNILVEFPDGQKFELNDWCGLSDSKLIDLEGSEAFSSNLTYVAAKEIDSGACLIADANGQSAGALGNPGYGPVGPVQSGMSPGAIGGIIGGLVLLGAAAGGGGGGSGGGGGPAPTPKPATPSGAADMTAASDSGSSSTDDNTNTTIPSFAIAPPGAGETPSLYVDGKKVAATFDPATNTLTPTVPLAEGPHTISYTLTDANGESARSPELPIIVDLTAPVPPAAVAPDMTAGTDTGASSIDNNTSNSSPSFVVPPAGPGEKAVLLIDGSPVPTTVSADGTTLTPINPIPNGAHTVSYAYQDAAGNISATSPALAIAINNLPPGSPTGKLDPGSDTGIVGDEITADTTPAISGTGTPGDTITVTLPDGSKLTDVVNPDGTWQVTPTTPLPNGNTVVTIVASSPTGIQSAPFTTNFVIDAIAPSAPTITAIPENASGGAINATEAADGTIVQVSIPANAKAGDILTLNIGGSQVPYTIQASDIGATANVTVSATTLANLSDGTVPVSATITDAAGNVSTPSLASNLTLDRSAPSAPSISSVPENASGINATEASDGVVVNVGLPGDAKAGDTLTVIVNGTATAVILTALDIGNGIAPVTIPVGSLPAADGTYPVTAQVTDAAGNAGTISAPFDITLDRGLPGAPAGAPDMTAGTDSGSSNTDDTTKDTTPDFAIPAPGAGETPSLYVDGVKAPATFDALTNTLTPTSPLSEGPHSITYTLTDASGNESAQSPSLPVTIDTTASSAPAAPDMTTATDSGTNTSDDNTNDTTPDFTVTVPVGHTATLYVDGVAVPATLVGGVLTPTNPLPDGAHSLTYTVTDPAGNESAQSSSLAITIDTTATGAPTITAAPENTGGGINQTEALSNNSAGQPGTDLSVSVPADAKVGDVLTLKLGSAVGAPTVTYTVQAADIGGTATVPVPKTTLDLLGDGTIPVTATLTDAAGNTSAPSAPFDITLDRGLPGAPAGAPDMTAGTDSGSSNTDNTTKDTTPDFAIPAPGAGETPSLYVDGVKVSATFDALTNTLTPTSPLSEGPHSITYTLTDASGNESAQSPSLPVTIDTTASSAPAAPDMTTATDSGSNNIDDNTNDTTPSFSVTPPAAGEMPSLYIDGVKVPATFDSLTNTLTPANPVPDGAHSITTTVTDAAGNESPQGPSLAINVDTTAPSAPTITAAPENSGGGINDAEANSNSSAGQPGTDLQVSIPVDAKAGDVLTLKLGSAVGAPTVTYTVLAGDIGGTATVPVPKATLDLLSDGTIPVTATLTDAAGNTSTPSATFNITLDRGAPGAPGALDLLASSDSGSSASDDYTNDSTPTISGAAVEPGATVTLYDTDGTTALGTTVADGSGNWSITPSASLTDGVHSFTTKQTDSSGNTSPASAPLAVTIDTGIPSTPAAPDLSASSDMGLSATDNNTNETTPEFAVTPPGVGEVLSLYIDGVKVPATFSAGTGALTPTNPIADGPHTITYTVTDQAGNESGQSPGLAVTIDTTAPSAPVINSIPENSGGGVTTVEQADGTVIRVDIPSSAKDQDHLLLFVGGQPVSYTIVAAEIGNTVNVPVAKSVLDALGNNGVHSVTAQITDQAGNVSSSSSSYPLVLTNVLLTSPIITAIPENNNGGINQLEASDGTFVTVDVTGAFSAAGFVAYGDTLRVTISGVSAELKLTGGTVGTPVSGPFSVFFSAGQLPLVDGTYSATAVILSGNPPGVSPGTDSPPFAFVLDRTAPSAPSSPIDMTAGTDTGASSTDDNTQDTTPDFVITAPGAGETPSLYVDGLKVAANFDAQTNTLTPINPLSDGPHTIRYTLTDAAGNESPQSTTSLAITIDSTVPSAPAAPDMTSTTDSGASNADNDTRDTTPDFTVSVPASHTAKLYVDGVAVPATLVAGVLTPTNPLPDGPHTVTYTLTDLAGNESAQSPSLAINIDTTAPSAPVITAVPENSNGGVNAAESSDGTTIQVSIPADAKAGDTLTLTVGGQPPFTYTVLAGDVGATANAPVTAGLLTALPNGDVSVTATLTDAAGNTSAPSAPFVFTLDKAPPGAPTALDLLASSDSGVSSIDDNTSDNTPTITGAPVEAGATVTLYDSNGTTVLGTTIADASGNWSITSSALADGVHNFTVKQTDVAGNQGPASAALPVTIDTTAPTAPIAPDMTAATDSGTSTTDNNTNDTTPSFTVAVPAAGETPKLYVDGVLVPSTFDSLTNALTPTNPIADGAHSVTTTITDAAGNESIQSPSLAISIDTTAPSAPSVTAVPENSNGGINAVEDNNGTIIQVSIPADVKAGDTLTLSVGGQSVTYTILAGDVGGTANVPVLAATLDAIIADGTYDITATLTDAAGNTGATSAPFTFTLDRTAPSAPIALDLLASSDSGASSADDVTSDTTPTITGAPVEAGATVTLYDSDGTTVIGITVADGSGNWSITSSALTDGVHNFTVKQTDQAGNQGPASAALPVTIDTTKPVAPAAPDMTTATDSGTNTTDSNTNDTTPSFTVAVPAAGEIPKLYVDGVLVPSTFDSLTNTLTPTNPIADGAHSVTTTITDAAGNESIQSPSLAINIDTTAPSAPSVTAVPENSNGGVNAAEASDGTTIQISIPAYAKAGDTLNLLVGGQPVTYTILAGDIGATANVPVGAGVLAALTDGTVPVSATLTDAAGNTSVSSSPFSFILDRTPPGAPGITSVPENAGGGINANEGADGTTVNISLPSGTKAGDTITLNVGGTPVTYVVTAGDVLGGSSAVPVSASVLASAVAPSGEGAVSLTATVTDAAGNVGPASTPFSINVDLSGPGAPQIASVPDNTQGGISVAEAADGSIVNVDISGIGAKVGDVITLDWGGSPVSYTLTATDIGNNNAPVLVSSATINTRGSGTFDLTTTLTDSAGNVSPPSTPFTVKVDIVPPFAPTITAIPESSGGGINAAEAADGTPIEVSLAGTDAEAGDVVNLSWGGQLVAYTLTATDITNGTATINVPSGVISSVGDGIIPVVVASITDGVGNAGPASVPFTVVVDTTALAAPTIASIPESSGGIGKTEAADGTVVNVTLPSGTVAGDTVTLNFGGQVISYTVLAGDVGSGSAPIFVSKAILETVAGGPNGTANNVPVTATVTDQAGNVSAPSVNFPVNIDFTNPSAPGALDLTTASDTGASNTDNITSDDTPTISGLPVEAGATVTLYDTDGTTVLGTTVADGSGNWSITPSAALSPGVHTFTTKQTDTAGNQSTASTPLAVTIVTGAPTPGTPDMTAGTDSGSSNVDNITNDTTPDFTISGVNGNTISVFADVNNDGIFNAGDIALGSAVVVGGVGTITAAPALAVGNYNIRATQTDLGGNGSAASSPLAITVDTAAPSTVTPALDLIAADDTGSSSTDNRTNKTAYTINATGLEPGATAQLKEGATIIATVTVGAGGTATFNVTGATTGAHNYSVTQTDVAGNPSTTATLLTVTVDTAAPSAPTPELATASDSGSSSTDNLTNATTPVITGAAVEAGATVTLYDTDGTTVLGTTVADGVGAWSITPGAALSAGVHNLTTKQTDTAGNQGAASSALAVTIDTSGPSFSNPDVVNEGFASTVLNSATLSGSDNVTASGSLEVISAVFKSSGTFVAGDLSFGAPSGGAITMTRTGGVDKNGSVIVTVQMRDAAGNVTTQDVTLTVNGVNDAPAGADKTITATEDTNYVFATSDFGFTDPSDSPTNTLQGVKITTAPGAGTLYNDANGNGVVDVGEAVAASTTVTAVDIAAGKLKFVAAPNANGTGYANFTFQVQDNGGTLNSGVDLDASANTATINVTAINDAPTLDASKSPTIATPEYVFSGGGDAGVHAPTGASPTGSLLVSSLVDLAAPSGQVDNVTDVDTAPSLGMGITALSNGLGTTLWYTTNGGTTWNWTTNTTDSGGGKGLFGADGVAGGGDDRVLMLGADGNTKIIFDGGGSGSSSSLADAIAFRAWDQTSGTAGVFVSNPSTGGTSSLSSATDTVQVNFTSQGIDLSRLETSAGVTITGATANAKFGWDVSAAGDVNGDGYEDFLVAENGVAATGKGQAFLYYGQAAPLGTATPTGQILAGATGAGATFTRGTAGETMEVVSNLGDINNDGYNDILIAGRSATNSGRDGKAYVMFGSGTGIGTTANVESIAAGKGFGITAGADSGLGFNPDSSGWVGDVNGDGYNDLIIGDRFGSTSNGTASPNGGSMAVIYGHAGTNFGGTTLNMSAFINSATNWDAQADAGGVAGHVFDAGSNTRGVFLGAGVADGSNAGQIASGLGDMNGDGYADWGFGRSINSANNNIVGFGKVSTDFSGNVLSLTGGTADSLGSGNTGNNTRWAIQNPATATSTTALRGVVNVGDVNGDGLSDAAFIYTDNNTNVGSVYIVAGSTDTDEDGTNVTGLGTRLLMTINGASATDNVTGSVREIGDLNGDGFDDFAVGVANSESSGGSATNQGGAYILYGAATPTATLNLATALTPAQGLFIRGNVTGDQAGFAVSGAGDVNGDGLDDLLIGAPFSDQAGTDAGVAYLIYGGANYGNSVNARTIAAFNGTGNTAAVETVIGTVAADSMTGSGIGAGDSASMGAGNDLIITNATTFQRIDGGTGNDTLRLNAGATWDFTSTSNLSGKVRSIETLDLGTGNQTLRINAQDVLNMSESTNVLRVTGTAGDTVDLSEVIGTLANQWHNMGTAGGITTYQYFNASNIATLAQVLIDSTITTS